MVEIVEVAHPTARYSIELELFFQDVAYGLDPGTVTALIGPAECGKTVAALLAAIDVADQDGTVLVVAPRQAPEAVGLRLEKLLRSTSATDRLYVGDVSTLDELLLLIVQTAAVLNARGRHLNAVVVDDIPLLASAEERILEIKEVVGELKALAKKLKMTALVTMEYSGSDRTVLPPADGFVTYRRVRR